MSVNIRDRFLTLGVSVLLLGLLFSTWNNEASGINNNNNNKMYRIYKSNLYRNRSIPKTSKQSQSLFCGINCNRMSPTNGKRKVIIVPQKTLMISPTYNTITSKLLIPYNNETGFIEEIENFKELAEVYKQKRKYCRNQTFIKIQNNNNNDDVITFKTFPCEKLKWMSWLLNQLKKNSTDIFTPYIKLTSSANINIKNLNESELMPENWGEKFIFRIIEKFGESTDKLFFHKFKQFTKSKELQVYIPHLIQLNVSPRTHVETGRTFFDPGFNLKLKLPFFHDELKFAVSTGPSFIAGLAVGIVVLGIKSIFSPFILAFKAYLLSWFFKDMSPFDFMKAITGRVTPETPEPSSYGWERPLEMYEPPEVHNTYDDKKSAFGTLSNMLTGSFFPTYETNTNSFSQPPVNQNHYSAPTYSYTGSHWDNSQGRTQTVKPTVIAPIVHTPDVDESEQDPSYIPSSALQQEVENFDPFYSPLLSRIDSIFMHLGFTEEGCKERAVCSIYKFPVKYAPYSNLLSAQLSKHQSELKRPVSTSPKILRYFKYMKAAKDGQASLNCIELYPRCTNDTEKLSNLPMVKTFQQLTELIGTGSG